MNKKDIARLKLTENEKISIRSDTGTLSNLRVREFDIKEGNALTYYPEANVLVSRTTDDRSKTPAFKSIPVWVER